jgi:hypothetical protein
MFDRGQGFDSRAEARFVPPHRVQTANGLSQFTVRCLSLMVPPGVKWLEREANHPP